MKVGHAIQAINLAARTAYKHQQLTAFSVLFSILEKLARNKNAFASSIYQILSDYAVSYHNDEEIREFLLVNLGKVIQNNQSIPLEV